MPSAYKKKKVDTVMEVMSEVLLITKRKRLGPEGCGSSKIKHESKKDAELAARAGMLAGAPTLTVYCCMRCNSWHLTSALEHPSPRKKRAH